jgi:two-component system LytT family response regulator
VTNWRAYVVDDEPLAVDRLVRLLEQTGRVTIAGASTSPHAARTFLQSQTVDLLFLDINMPRMNGFELLSELENPPCVVFSTAYDQFALRAFEVNSIDYLLKPVEKERLERALDKFERLRAQGQPPVDFERVCQDVVNALRTHSSEYPERLASRLGQRICFLELANVTHVYAENKLTYAVTEGRPYSIDAPLTELEKRLDPKRFIRIHRAALVNVRWVSEVHAGLGGTLVLQLRDGTRTRLAVARSRAAEVKARLGA